MAKDSSKWISDAYRLSQDIAMDNPACVEAGNMIREGARLLRKQFEDLGGFSREDATLATMGATLGPFIEWSIAHGRSKERFLAMVGRLYEVCQMGVLDNMEGGQRPS